MGVSLEVRSRRALSGMWSSYHINLHLTSQFLLVHQLESLEAVGINSNFSIMTNITYRFLSDSDDTGLRFVTRSLTYDTVCMNGVLASLVDDNVLRDVVVEASARELTRRCGLRFNMCRGRTHKHPLLHTRRRPQAAF